MGGVTLLFRLLVLGISTAGAGAIGIAIAHRYPAQVTEPPLAERAIREVERWQSTVGSLVSGRSPMPDPSRTEPSSPSPGVTPSPVSLTTAEQQLVQTEIDRMREELQGLRDRTARLESRLSIPATSASVEARLQQMQQVLTPEAALGDSFVSAPAVSIADAAQDRTLQITLPSDALFDPDGALLRPSARAILDSIAVDLRAYPGALVQVAAHTDSAADAPTQRRATFEQARVVLQHLRSTLGDDYRWLSLGYGNTQPLTEGTTSVSQQRNRRVEITITPR